jgi:hypothetical protein
MMTAEKKVNPFIALVKVIKEALKSLKEISPVNDAEREFLIETSDILDSLTRKSIRLAAKRHERSKTWPSSFTEEARALAELFEKKTGKSRDDIIKKVEKSRKDLDYLLTETGALLIMCDNHGINVNDEIFGI